METTAKIHTAVTTYSAVYDMLEYPIPLKIPNIDMRPPRSRGDRKLLRPFPYETWDGMHVHAESFLLRLLRLLRQSWVMLNEDRI
eukprot:1620904-Pyramimonas_sp.AAC.1